MAATARLRLAEQAEYTLQHACGAEVTLTAAELAAAAELPPCPCEATEADQPGGDAA